MSVAYLVSRDYASALEPAERALKLIQALASAKPEDQSLRAKLAGMLSSVGDGLFETGRLPEAQEKFQAAYAIFDGMLNEAPDSLFLIRWKSVCMERFGNIKMLEKDFAAAVQVFGETLELKQRLLDADAGNVRFQADFGIIAKKLETAKELVA